jgi:hypothetical protein
MVLVLQTVSPDSFYEQIGDRAGLIQGFRFTIMPRRERDPSLSLR